jgi:NCAIR mutase (PurE)-related protein
MTPDSFQDLITGWQQGALEWATVEESLRSAFATTVPTADIQVDLDRVRRCGFPEVVFGTGKSAESIIAVFHAQVAAGQNSLATRVSTEQATLICQAFPNARPNPIARTVALTSTTTSAASLDEAGRVIVVTAGTSDRPVAEEALETVLWMGCEAELIMDVGVAGPHRLIAQRERLQSAAAVVVVAGMEGALPSVVAGWVAVPVIAVPTSVGYGANLGGFSALLSMLNSCAANVAVVNIDAGFKGGYLAAMIARQTCRPKN